MFCQSSCFCLVLCLGHQNKGNETAYGNTHTFTTQSNRELSYNLGFSFMVNITDS